ncbi:MAG: hypothetical protein ACK4NS_01020 [Saprospiraceae bacterium]
MSEEKALRLLARFLAGRLKKRELNELEQMCSANSEFSYFMEVLFWVWQESPSHADSDFDPDKAFERIKDMLK